MSHATVDPDARVVVISDISAPQQAALDQTIAAKDTAVAAKDTAVAQADIATQQATLADQHEDAALVLRNETLTFRNQAETEAAEAVGASTDALAYRDTTQGYMNDTLTARDTTLGYRNTTQTLKDAAALSEQNAAASETAVTTMRNEVEADRSEVATNTLAVEADRSEVATNTAEVEADRAAVQSMRDETLLAIDDLGFPDVHIAEAYPRRTADNLALEYRTPSQVLSDISAEPARTAVSQAEAEAGTEVTIRGWNSLRVRQAAMAAIATWVDTAPVALDTLNELAAALGDDPNFSTTITNLIGTKLNSDAVSAFVLDILNDPDAATFRQSIGAQIALSTVTQGEAEAGTATAERLWTSQRVRQAIESYVPAGDLRGGNETVITTNSAITVANNCKVLVANAATAITWTLDAPATLGDKFLVFISNTGLGDLTVTGTFDNGDTEITLEQGQSMAITCNGAVHRLLLRGGGAGGGGSVIPLMESGVGDGTNKITLTNTPASEDAMILFIGGVVQAKTKFSLAGNDVLLDNGEVFLTGETWHVFLMKGGASVVGVAPLYKRHQGDGTAGPFTLQAVPTNNASLSIRWGGLAQPKDGSAYTFVGDQITFAEPIDASTYWEEEILQPVGIGVPNPESVGATEIKANDVSAIRDKLELKSASLADVVGTVSQSAGVSTGSIIERGSNANGEYVRYADGTQICWRRTSFTTPVTTSIGSGYLSPLLTVGGTPASFVGTPNFFTSLTSINGGAFPFLREGDGTTFPDLQVAWFASLASYSVTANIVAIGRWF